MKSRVFRHLLVAAMLTIFAVPSFAGGRTDARCGLSLGAVIGPSIPRAPEIKDEFQYLFHIEADAKYYFLHVFSFSGALGYEYGNGYPKRMLHEREDVPLDQRGTSFWRGVPIWGTLRLEPFRRFFFNPYLGAGVGTNYVIIERQGRAREISVTGSGSEWLPSTMGLAGFDYQLSEFFFVRLEGRYVSSPSRTDVFFEKKDLGSWDALAGINVYF